MAVFKLSLSPKINPLCFSCQLTQCIEEHVDLAVRMEALSATTQHKRRNDQESRLGRSVARYFLKNTGQPYAKVEIVRAAFQQRKRIAERNSYALNRSARLAAVRKRKGRNAKK